MPERPVRVTMIARRLAFVAGLALALSAGVAGAPPGGGPPGRDPRAFANVYANSWALVIGINAYQRAPRLNYAATDARAVADQLVQLGFPRRNIRLLIDGEATRAGIERVLYREFSGMGREDRLLVYFAGHGETLAVKGGEEGFILPVDAEPDALSATAISIDDLRRIGKRVRAKHVLFLMDACFSGLALTRDIVVKPTPDTELQLASREPVVQVLTAGRKGERAIEEGGHGLFTRRLLEGLRGHADTEGRGVVTAGDLASWLTPRVIHDSNGRMNPQYAKLDGEGQFLFVVPRSEKVEPPPRGSLVLMARLDGIEVSLDGRRVGDTKAGQPLVIESLAPGVHRVTALKSGHATWEREVHIAANQRTDVLVDIEPLQPPRMIRSDDGAEMVLVPAGEFWMGSDADEIGDLVGACKRQGRDEGSCRSVFAREQPRHRVVVDAFYVDRFEVTNAQFDRFVTATSYRTTAEREGRGWVHRERDGWVDTKGASWRAPDGPSTERPSNAPVSQVSWHDAATYCRWAGKRLPTEAEWEKAARGTEGRRYPWGDAWDSARVKTRSSTGPLAVGMYPPGASPYGAHDMAGSVWEWVADWFERDYYKRSPERNPTGPTSGQFKVLRGGSWADALIALRTAYREPAMPDTRNAYLGFRCVRDAAR